jgi:hypothetical protein
MRAHAPVNTRAANADKNSQVPRGPPRVYAKGNSVYLRQDIGMNMKPAWAQVQRGDGELTFVPFTIGTHLVVLKFQQTLDSLRILGGLPRGRTSRHSSMQRLNNGW